MKMHPSQMELELFMEEILQDRTTGENDYKEVEPHQIMNLLLHLSWLQQPSNMRKKVLAP